MARDERARRHGRYLDKQRARSTKRLGRRVGVGQPAPASPAKPCGCGSGRPFKACCFRPDHPRFDLHRYMTACKDVLNTLRALMQAWLVNEYNRGIQVIRDATDAISARLGMPTLEAFQRAHSIPTDFFSAVEVRGTRDILEGTLAFQELAQTTHLTGLRVPLLNELTGELITRGRCSGACSTGASTSSRIRTSSSRPAPGISSWAGGSSSTGS